MKLRRTVNTSLLLMVVSFMTLSCSTGTKRNGGHELLNGVLWMEHAAEYRALARQAYRTASQMLPVALKDSSWTAALEQTAHYRSLPPAVILDVDETVLNNAPYEARLIKTGQSYNRDSWNAWCREARAKAIPGAVEFCKFAVRKGVEVFFVTNRREELRQATFANLKKEGFPLQPDGSTLIMRTGSGDKGERRAKLAQKYRILLLIGDSGGDFASGFSHSAEPQRNRLVKQYREYWGSKWIVLPNPSYGDWEGALYDYRYDLNRQQKLREKMKKLED